MRWVAQWFGLHMYADHPTRRFAGQYRAWYILGILGFAAIVFLLTALQRTMSPRLRLPLLVMLPLFAFWGPAFLFRCELQLLWPTLRPFVSYASETLRAYFGLMVLPRARSRLSALCGDPQGFGSEGSPGLGLVWSWTGLVAVLVMRDG